MSEARERYLDAKKYIRNRGYFDDRISDYVSELEQQKAELLQAIESALNKSTKGGWLCRIFENIIEKHNIKI